MTVAISVLFAATLVAVWTSFCYALHYREHRGDELHFTTTQDGWKIALLRYLPRGKRRRRAVVLCHGLSANHMTYDLAAEVSLARYLAAQGFDVWVLQLRGRGWSDRPWPGGNRSYGWCFDHYLQYDAVAAISYVRENSPCDSVHWVGHSMGGILLYCLLSVYEDASIRSGIAIGSSLEYDKDNSDFRYLLPLRGITRWVRMAPFGILCLWLSPLSGWFTNPLECFSYWPSNVAPRLIRRLNASTFHSISAPVLGQLATAFEAGGLRSIESRMRYLEGLEKTKVPVLAIAGDRDRQCPIEAARSTWDKIGARDKSFLAFGPGHGHGDHYGHFDLLVGKRVREEVFPHVLEWLDRHDTE